MTSDYKNITIKSKAILLQASRDYNAQGNSCVPYEELIIYNDKYPEFLFLIHKNMLFAKGSICDTSYNVFTFDKDGNYVKKEDVEGLGREFFRNMKVLKKL